MRHLILPALAMLGVAAPLHAQIDWHAPRQAGKVWERKIDENNLEASRRSAEQRAQAEAADAAWDAPLSAADRKGTLARNRAEYERRLRLGEGFAENWLDRKARMERFERQEKGALAEAGEALVNARESEEPGTASADPEASIAFERSDSLTRQLETMVANNLAENFSLDFMMADPQGFIRSGQARAVYQHELAARNYSADTLEGATALMFGLAWELANGRELTAVEHAAIVRQATVKLRADGLEGQDDAARQAQADPALLIAGLWLEEARLREGSPEQMRDLSAAVNRDMQKMSGSDMRAHAIGATGIVER